MAKFTNREPSLALYRAILQLKDLEECQKFFEDVCTVTEMRSMEQRYDVAVLLSQGKIYNDILSQTGASSATISRVSRMLNSGTGVLKSYAEKEEPLLADRTEK
ncbi:MAG: YerC/YecD family TrpR-related protein [Butyricicoccus sp.]